MGWRDRWRGIQETTVALAPGTVTTTSSVVSTTQTRSTQTSESLLHVNAIPFMRPKRVDFTAVGLKPYEIVKPYFYGTDVSAWTAPVVGGNGFGNTITADVQGKVSGSFYIPAAKFRTGTTSFVLASDDDIAEADSYAETNFSSIGQLETRQTTSTTTVVNNINTNFVTTNTTPPIVINNFVHPGADPLAQSFFVFAKTTSPVIFVTKFDVFVATKDPKEDLMLELRELDNGYPGKKIIAKATKAPGSITVSADGSVPTTFEFSSPVMINNNSEYCIVLKTNSTKYTVHIAKLGGTDKLKKTAIGKQPNAGVLFQSTNDSTWTAMLDADMKFTMYVANFTLSSALVKTTTKYPNYKVAYNTHIETVNGTKRVRIFCINHGFTTDKVSKVLVNIKLPDGQTTLNGIAIADVNAVHTVTYADSYSFEITVTASATSAASSGLVPVDRLVFEANLMADAAMIGVAENIPEGTTTSYSFQGVFGKSADGTAANLYTKTGTVATEAFDIIPVKQPLCFLNYNTAVQQFGNNAPTNILNITMSTTDKYVSPFIDLKRTSICTLTSHLNDINPTTITDLPTDDQIPETDTKVGFSLTRYTMKPVSLELPATSLRVQFAGNIVTGNSVDVYYRTLPSSEEANISTVAWTVMSLETGDFVNATEENVYYDYSYEVAGLPEFTVFQVKVVPRGTNSRVPPAIKDFRCLALAV